MPATLIVVDMQPKFLAANSPEVIVGVTREILEAKERNSGIIFLEYTPINELGRTHRGFSNLVKGYQRKSLTRKAKNDGSLQVVRALKRRGFSKHTLRVCGVNTDCCVAETVCGLVGRLRHVKIEVVKDACHSEYQKEYDWRRFTKHPRIRLV